MDFFEKEFSPLHGKKTVLILTDVDVNMYLKWASNENWGNLEFRNLKKVKVSDFEIVEPPEMKTPN